MFPDGDWGGCCVEHDRAYWAGGSRMQRLEADIRLMLCVARKRSIWLGIIMFIGVQFGGAPWLPFPWRWGYGWTYKKSYSYAKQEKLPVP